VDFNFSNPDRRGRLLTFMAMANNDFWFDDVKGIGIVSHAAVAVNSEGIATVFGSDS